VLYVLIRAYDPNDSVNPDAQLDPATGKSYAYGKKKKKADNGMMTKGAEANNGGQKAHQD